MLWTIFILRKIIHLYIFILFVTALLSWANAVPMKYEIREKVYKVYSFLLKFSEPITSRIDRVIKPVSLGNINLSVSFIILFALVFFIDTLLVYLAGWYIAVKFGISF